MYINVPAQIGGRSTINNKSEIPNFENRKKRRIPKPKVNVKPFIKHFLINSLGFFSMPALSRSSLSVGNAFSKLDNILFKILTPLS